MFLVSPSLKHKESYDKDVQRYNIYCISQLIALKPIESKHNFLKIQGKLQGLSCTVRIICQYFNLQEFSVNPKIK